jgi:hypothetical protein
LKQTTFKTPPSWVVKEGDHAADFEFDQRFLVGVVVRWAQQRAEASG